MIDPLCITRNSTHKQRKLRDPLVFFSQNLESLPENHSGPVFRIFKQYKEISTMELFPSSSLHHPISYDLAWIESLEDEQKLRQDRWSSTYRAVLSRETSNCSTSDWYQAVCMKVFSPDGACEEVQADIVRTIKSLPEAFHHAAFFSHPNIAELVGCAMDEGERMACLIFGCSSGRGYLDEVLRSDEESLNFRWRFRVREAAGLSEALLYLNEDNRRRGLHVDVRSKSVLVGHGYECKLTEYNLARLEIDNEMSSPTAAVGSIQGSSEGPEAEEHGEGTVVQAFGRLLIEMLSGEVGAGVVKVPTDWDDVENLQWDTRAGTWRSGCKEAMMAILKPCLEKGMEGNLGSISSKLRVVERNYCQPKAMDSLHRMNEKLRRDLETQQLEQKSAMLKEWLSMRQCLLCLKKEGEGVVCSLLSHFVCSECNKGRKACLVPTCNGVNMDKDLARILTEEEYNVLVQHQRSSILNQDSPEVRVGEAISRQRGQGKSLGDSLLKQVEEAARGAVAAMAGMNQVVDAGPTTDPPEQQDLEGQEGLPGGPDHIADIDVLAHGQPHAQCDPEPGQPRITGVCRWTHLACKNCSRPQGCRWANRGLEGHL
eukprot:758907-Hanusia_phi.AAC.1